MKIEHHVTNAGIRVAAFALAAVCGGLFAQAATIEIKDAPFGEFGITVPEFAERDFRASDFVARAGASRNGVGVNVAPLQES